jgi:hypothetical protein
MKANAAEKEPVVIYTIASAARRLNTTYQKLVYALARRWLIPLQHEPEVLITETELFRYAHERDIEIPEI